MRFSWSFAAGKDSRSCISTPARRFIMFYTAKHFNFAVSSVICDVVWLSLARKCVKAGAAVSMTLRNRKCRRVRRKTITMWVDKSIIFHKVVFNHRDISRQLAIHESLRSLYYQLPWHSVNFHENRLQFLVVGWMAIFGSVNLWTSTKKFRFKVDSRRISPNLHKFLQCFL